MRFNGTRMFANFRCARLCAVLISISALCGAPTMLAEPHFRLLFAQHDKVISFTVNPTIGTAVGVESGTATGAIKGTTLTNFSFAITTFPDFTFDDQVGITDLDGDQIIFKNVGTGRFIVPGLVDPTQPVSNQVLFSTTSFLGGPLTGTYVVVATSGKYIKQYPLGTVFQYRAITMNPNSPPAPAGSLGSTYVEVYAPENFHVDK
jgi:hypothetical protein